MTANKKEKSLARALAKSQGVSYTEALRQLREERALEAADPHSTELLSLTGAAAERAAEIVNRRKRDQEDEDD